MRKMSNLLLSAGALALAHSAPAWSQEKPASEEEAVQSGEAIVVTGTRIANSGFAAATPVTAVMAEDLAASQPSTIAAALNNLPSLRSFGGPQSNSGSTGGGQNFLDLRGLGPIRTLVLLDGRRMVSSTADSRVDTNLIPSAIVKRVDVVTGGASAAYGSDAVSGVVNFVLDNDYTGVKGELSKGISEEGDNAETRASLTFGTRFADGRGHLLVSGEIFDNNGVAGDGREIRRQNNNFILNPAGGTPVRIAVPQVRAIATYGGLIVNASGGTAAANASFRGIQFGPGGAQLPYNYGTMQQGITTTNGLQSGGDGVNTAVLNEIVRPLNRKAVFARATYEVADDIKLFAEGIYGRTQAINNILTTQNTGNFALTIRRDNAFLPTDLRDRMVATGVQTLTMTRYASEGGAVLSDNRNETFRGVVGLDAKLGGLTLNAYYTHGQNENNLDLSNNQITANFTKAVDSVISNGQAVCRSTLTDPTNGCVAYNPFGVGSPSAAALAYINGVASYHLITKQDAGALTLSGNLFDMWAGPVSAAAGVEARHESVVVTTSALSAGGAFRVGNASPFTGSYSIKEAFAELEVPLAKDASWMYAMSLNGAVRYADYSTAGGATTWKLGASISPIPDIRFRVTRSRDIRAPNLSELYSAGRQGVALVNDPQNGNALVGPFPTFPSGSTTLKPEKSDALVAGVVFEPSFIPGLNLSFDYYDIKINGAINALGAQQAVDECQRGSALACSFVNRDSAGQITSIRTVFFNLNSLKTRGFDIEASYRVPIDQWFNTDAKLTLRNYFGYVSLLQTETPGATPINRVGQLQAPGGNTPRFRNLTTVSFEKGGFSSFLQGRLISSGKVDVTWTPNDANFNDVKAQYYLDGQISYTVKHGDRSIQFYLNVQNLLNHQAPFVPVGGNVAQPTNPNLYDQIGRNYRAGIKVKL